MEKILDQKKIYHWYEVPCWLHTPHPLHGSGRHIFIKF